MKTARLISLILVLVTFDLAALAQSDSISHKYKPYELLSSYYSNDFEPFKKSNIYVGLAMSLQNEKLENSTNLLRTVLNGNQQNYEILLKGGYFINDYAMAGIKFSYHQKKFVGTIYQSPDTLQSNVITRGFTVTPNFRSSVPLTPNERLSFFTEIGVSYGRSNTLKRDIYYLDTVNKTYVTHHTFNLGISPGLTFFAMENFAFEVQLNVLGYTLDMEKKQVDEEAPSKHVSHNVNFSISLLTMDLGLSYYFGARKHKSY